MKKRGIIFGFILSLLAGIILGVSAGLFLFPKIFPPPRPSVSNDKNMPPPPLTPAAVQEKIMRRLESKLELTQEQKVQVEKEVKIFAEELDKFHSSNREELKSMYDAFIVKLSKLIPGEKADRLRKISGDISNPPPPPSERRMMQGKDDRRPPPRDENNPPDDSDRRPPPQEK